MNTAKFIAVAESNSTVPVNAHLLREDRPKRPPIFITVSLDRIEN